MKLLVLTVVHSTNWLVAYRERMHMCYLLPVFCTKVSVRKTFISSPSSLYSTVQLRASTNNPHLTQFAVKAEAKALFGQRNLNIRLTHLFMKTWMLGNTLNLIYHIWLSCFLNSALNFVNSQHNRNLRLNLRAILFQLQLSSNPINNGWLMSLWAQYARG